MPALPAASCLVAAILLGYSFMFRSRRITEAGENQDLCGVHAPFRGSLESEHRNLPGDRIFFNDVGLQLVCLIQPE